LEHPVRQATPLQTKTFETRAEAEQWARAIEVEMDKGAFVSRAEAESTTLKELLERHLEEVTLLKKGAEPETNRLRLMMRHALGRRFVAGVGGVDIARWRDERLRKITPATVKRDMVLLGHVFEVASITGHKDLRMLRRYAHLKATNCRCDLLRSFASSLDATIIHDSEW
jgi:hypothetical protein